MQSVSFFNFNKENKFIFIFGFIFIIFEHWTNCIFITKYETKKMQQVFFYWTLLELLFLIDT